MILLDTSAIEQSQTEESSFFFYIRLGEMQLPLPRHPLSPDWAGMFFRSAQNIKKKSELTKVDSCIGESRAQTGFLGAEFLSVDFPAQQEQKKKEVGITGATRYLFIQEPER